MNESRESRKVKRHSYELMLSLWNNWDSDFSLMLSLSHSPKSECIQLLLLYIYNTFGHCHLTFLFLYRLHDAHVLYSIHTRQQTRQLNFHIKFSTFPPFSFTPAPVASHRFDRRRTWRRRKRNTALLFRCAVLCCPALPSALSKAAPFNIRGTQCSSFFIFEWEIYTHDRFR